MYCSTPMSPFGQLLSAKEPRGISITEIPTHTLVELVEIHKVVVERIPANHLFNSGRVALHWDGAYIPETPRFNVFQCVDASDKGTGGETFFSNTVKIWEEATDEEWELWSRTQLTYSTEKKAHYGGTILVSLADRHPRTGERVLCFIEPFNEDKYFVESSPVLGDGHLQS